MAKASEYFSPCAWRICYAAPGVGRTRRLKGQGGVAADSHFERDSNGLGGAVLGGEYLTHGHRVGPLVAVSLIRVREWKPEYAWFYADPRLYFFTPNGDIALVSRPRRFAKGPFHSAGREDKQAGPFPRGFAYPVILTGGFTFAISEPVGLRLKAGR